MPTCPVLARATLVLLAACGAPSAPIAPAPTPVEAPPMSTPPTTPDPAPAQTSATITIPTPYVPDSDVRGSGSALGLAIEVVDNVEKRTMEGNSLMRVGLRLHANGATESVTLYSDAQPRVTWGGYTVEHRGGWRHEVELLISLAPAGPAPAPAPGRPGDPPAPTPPPAPVSSTTISIPARARAGVSPTASVLGLDVEVKDVLEAYMNSGGTTMVIKLELRAGGATTMMTLDSGEHARQSWRGYTLAYTGGWRDTVDLVVTRAAR